MTNSERFHKAKALISEAKNLLEPLKDDLLSRHNKKFKLRYSDNDPLPDGWEECQQLSRAANTVISMIVDLEELEQESIAIPV